MHSLKLHAIALTVPCSESITRHASSCPYPAPKKLRDVGLYMQRTRCLTMNYSKKLLVKELTNELTIGALLGSKQQVETRNVTANLINKKLNRCNFYELTTCLVQKWT